MPVVNVYFPKNIVKSIKVRQMIQKPMSKFRIGKARKLVQRHKEHLLRDFASYSSFLLNFIVHGEGVVPYHPITEHSFKVDT